MPALAGKNGDGHEATDEDDVKEYAEECKKSKTPQEACQDDGECSVNDGAPGHALNRLFPSRDGLVVSLQPCQASAISNKNLDDIQTCKIP